MSIEKIKLAAAWLLLAGAATLLRFKTELQSDSLFLDSLFTDLFAHGGRWAEWKFIQAPAFLPDMLLYLLAYPLLPDAASRIFFVSFAQVLLLAGAILWCARQIYPQLSRAAQTTLLLLLAFVTLAAARSNMWLYFYSTNNHLGATLLGLVGVGLLLRQLNRPSRAGAALLIALIAAAQVSTKLFVLSFVAPLLVLLALALVALPRRQDWARRHRASAWRLLGLVFAAELLAAALGALLIRNNPAEGHRSVSPDTVANAIKLFLQATGAAFSPDNHWTQALAILLLLLLLYLGAALLRQLELAPDRDSLALRWPRLGGTLGWRYGAAAAMLAVGLPLNVFGSLLSAGFVDLSAYRYFTFPLTLAVMMAVILLDHRYRQRAAPWHGAALLLAAGVLAGGVHAARHRTPHADPASLVAGCLTAIEADGFRLQAGVGDYWNGAAVSYYLPRHNPVLVTLNDAAPLFWVSTLGPLLHPEHYPAHQHSNFALLRNADAGGQFDYTAATIGKLLPPPSRVQACPAAQMQIWLYDGPELDATVARIKADYLARRAARKR
ncbi:hypothetical protein GJ697_27425 [Pseudoduganella sp. FT25W]|jgi:hypothetical protein|uniref:Glycosyltransferase RgtA/B/C/D-like domain-containing protein n=2 Tax=Duganella alba TaxID=2666081 RepID=A0A6L5QNY3_9BURK|nr:hypothetical protein [Duganella alba]MRX11563.1 hypothetical protein [Duganella alba]